MSVFGPSRDCGAGLSAPQAPTFPGMAAEFTALLVIALYVLASARLTRIVVVDKIGDPIRNATIRRFGPGSMVTFLVHCPWCLGWWICLLLAFPTAVVAGVPWWWGFGLWPAGSYLVGLLTRWDSE